MTELVVRRAVAGDHGNLLELSSALATSCTVEVTPFTATLEALLPDQTSLLLVAERQAQVVGYVLAQQHHAFHANGAVVWVEEVMVAPAHRGTGVGRALMSAVADWGSDQGAAYVALATRRADGFYRALGYEPSATYYKRSLPPA